MRSVSRLLIVVTLISVSITAGAVWRARRPVARATAGSTPERSATTPASAALATSPTTTTAGAIAPATGSLVRDDAPLRAATFGRMMQGGNSGSGQNRAGVFDPQTDPLRPNTARRPREERLKRAGSFDGDLRFLPTGGRRRVRERAEHEEPNARPVVLPGTTTTAPDPLAGLPVIGLNAPAPAATSSFDGLDFNTWGAGHPPDTNGDAGPNHYIQTINTAVGIYRKTDGVRLAAFTFDTLMSQGNFGNLCDTENFGDPVVLYDTFEDRWIITDFAFQVDASSNVINPPGMFQCFAASKTGDPVSGGWNFYSINTTGGLGDYGKFGIWPDGLYMSVNMFNYAAGGAFQNVRLYALNKAQMYAGAASIQVVSFDAPASEFTLLPANARMQTGTPPTGTPNYFTSVWNFLNVVGVWKFHVDWNSVSLSTLTGPFNSTTSTNWSQFTGASGRAPTPGNALDTLYPRLMVQNQYSNIGGVESLWNVHTVGASGATSAQAAVRYYQVPVTGGNVASSATQAFTYSPDATTHRYMPSGAVDRMGNFAMGYTTSSATTNPGIRYAGRLATDPVNTISYTETSIIEGTGTQTSTNRWGDYSAMTLDPDGCTFWYTTEYYAANGGNHQTRIASFKFPECTTLANGSLEGTVRSSALGNPALAGVTVSLGSRTTTTNGLGYYSFANLPAGTYPSLTVTAAGYVSQSATGIVISSNITSTQDFTLTSAATSGCFVDTTQADFQSGTLTNCDATGSPNNVTLVNTPAIDQQNTTVTSSGFAFSSTVWGGQTFTAAVTGLATRIDLNLFCSGCTGTTPNVTASIRATSGGLPTGPDLATATINGFSSGAGAYYSATFASPTTLTAGTRYAVVFRSIANPSAGTYAYVCSCGTTTSTNPYANGARMSSSNSGGTWTADSTVGGRDIGFKVYVSGGFASAGTFVSSVKDANPAVGASVSWGTLSWNATVPSGSTLQFQAAGSNSAAGPFNFVGPNGTAATFFTSGSSLAQFNGMRYLKYQALLSSATGATAPTIADVSVCFTAGNANAPSITSASTLEDIKTASGLVITRHASDGTEVTHFKISNISGGALFKNDGVTPITDGAFITAAEGNAGLKFMPGANLFSPSTTFTFAAQASRDAAGTGLSGTTFATITVTPVADTPSVTNATACGGLISCSGLVISRNVADTGEVTHFKITAVSGGTVFKSDGVTAVPSGSFVTYAEGHAGLKFLLPLNTTTAGQFTAQASTSSIDAGLGGATVTATITVGTDPVAINTALTNAGNRLAAIQNADGGWYFNPGDTTCGLGAGISCRNTFGYTALGVLASYEHTGSAPLLTAAQNAGNSLVATYNAQSPKQPPYPADIEFLVALGQVTGNATYTTTATLWFNALMTAWPNAADRVDLYLSSRDAAGYRTLAAFDTAGLIRAAKAVGQLTYANAAATRIFARESTIVESGNALPGWKDTNVAHRWDQCPSCGDGTAFPYDYTLVGEATLLWAVHDISAFSLKAAEYTAFLLSQQDAEGSWDAGITQITSFVIMGLGSTSDPAANAAIVKAACFILAHQGANGGFPTYAIAGFDDGPENILVDAETAQALHLFFNTPIAPSANVRPSPLANARFTDVTHTGATTVVGVDASTVGPLPSGYTPLNVAYDLATTATAAADVVVCFQVPPTLSEAAFGQARVLHREGAALIDRTILAPASPAPDFTTRTLCARVATLNSVVLATYAPPPNQEPSLTVPANITTEATSRAGARVDFSVTAADAEDGNITSRVACSAAPGSLFPIGDTTVSCTVADSAGATTSASFRVRVTSLVAGRMEGEGSLGRGIRFSFEASKSVSDATAARLTFASSDRFVSSAITSVTFSDDAAARPGGRAAVDTVVIRGRGNWNGAAGYSFEAVAVDRGELGRRADTFAITIFDSVGNVVYTTSGTLTDGNIQSVRIQRERNR